MAINTFFLPSLLQNYLNDLLPEPEVLKELRQYNAQMNTASMQSAYEQGRLLAFFTQALNVKTILEIGTFTGASSLWMALHLPEDGKLLTLDINTEWTTTAQSYWKKAGVEEKISLALGKATQTLNTLRAEEAQFDLIFIDADKINYQEYYEKSLPLMHKNSLLLIDNTLWKGFLPDHSHQEASTRHIRAFNEKLKQDPRIEYFILPIGDGITAVRLKDTRSL